MSVRINLYFVTPMLVLTMAVITVLVLTVPAGAATDDPSLLNNLTGTPSTLTTDLGGEVSDLGGEVGGILPPPLGPTVSDTTEDLGKVVSDTGRILDPPAGADPGSGDPGTGPSSDQTASPGVEGSGPSGAGSDQPEPGTDSGLVAGATAGPGTLGLASQDWGISKAFSNSQPDGQQLRISPAGSTGTFANLDPVSAGLATLPLLGLLGAFLAVVTYLKSARGILNTTKI